MGFYKKKLIWAPYCKMVVENDKFKLNNIMLRENKGKSPIEFLLAYLFIVCKILMVVHLKKPPVYTNLNVIFGLQKP